MIGGNAGARVRSIGLSAAIALAIAGCVGAQTTDNPPTPAASTAPAAATASALPPTSPATQSPAATAAPPATAAPTPEAIDLTHVPAAPSGAWTNIHWVAVADHAPIATATPDPLAGAEEAVSTQTVWGWSRGYVAFSIVVKAQGEAGIATVSSAHSADGVVWQAGNTLQLPLDQPDVSVSGVYEGPSGLLAVGMTGACGDYWIIALWTSADGSTWTKVDMKKTFGTNSIERVTGGAAGFVATGESGSIAWTSVDGRTWRAIDFTASVFKHSRLDDGTAFGPGFVLAGSTEVPGKRGCGATTVDPAAPATPTPPLRMPSAWWSADGTTWTKSELPGASAAFVVNARTYRITDRSLLLSTWGWGPDDGHGQAWLSSDGRTWKALGVIAILPDSIVTDGRHAVQEVVSDQTADGQSTSPHVTLSYVGEDASMVTLTESGDLPVSATGVSGSEVWTLHWAVGPTGIVATDGARLWLGLPS